MDLVIPALLGLQIIKIFISKKKTLRAEKIDKLRILSLAIPIALAVVGVGAFVLLQAFSNYRIILTFVQVLYAMLYISILLERFTAFIQTGDSIKIWKVWVLAVYGLLFLLYTLFENTFIGKTVAQYNETLLLLLYF
ncbi:hypothetical protein KC660_03610 [Candidatus Dojkabacteria bacterium]|uniref:Uncharacterized protein n=1 Tax=Candidatus Dojkabacteria bacterium TaxID=2099670 RepID=A0A955RI64_9BACT|nr:hypothetical protein [Candidatus Dojkabacteria bacterium]